MYIVTFNIRSAMKFESLDSATDFLCSVDYGFVACFDDKNNDISFQIENAEKQFVMVDDYQLMVRTELCFGNCCFNIVSNKFFYRRFKKSRIYIENYIRFISER